MLVVETAAKVRRLHFVQGLGLYASRVRLIGRYFVGDQGVSGVSIGLGVSF